MFSYLIVLVLFLEVIVNSSFGVVKKWLVIRGTSWDELSIVLYSYRLYFVLLYFTSAFE